MIDDWTPTWFTAPTTEHLHELEVAERDVVADMGQGLSRDVLIDTIGQDSFDSWATTRWHEMFEPKPNMLVFAKERPGDGGYEFYLHPDTGKHLEIGMPASGVEELDPLPETLARLSSVGPFPTGEACRDGSRFSTAARSWFRPTGVLIRTRFCC